MSDAAIMADLRECFDRKGCDGLTVYVTTDGRVQANIRDRKSKAWKCYTHEDLDAAIAEVVRQFLHHNYGEAKRIVTVAGRKRKEIDSLA